MTQPPYPLPYGYPPPPRPPQRSLFRRLLPLWIALTVLFVALVSCAIAVGVSVGNEVQKVNKATGNHPEDVRLDSCTADAIGALRATITVTNSADRAATYSVEIAFNAADGAQIASGWALVTRLSPGQVAREEVAGSSRQAAGTQVGCRLLSARRTALP
jgi:hypothetical protein